ncbi:uncharacterized protein TNCV_1119561 [Trichonephila clavipes]|uniref:Uncharacterized protein n=1 Tax=Trichonephila clavipes TaxID=2585209 RepID=A0A8X6VJ65_TRICX|nr:uncharacterized protein TNCV_1119561 [Trichonephila clavipes]
MISFFTNIHLSTFEVCERLTPEVAPSPSCLLEDDTFLQTMISLKFESVDVIYGSTEKRKSFRRKVLEEDRLSSKQNYPYNCQTTRGLLAIDHVILNHGQVMWTTPELAPLLLTTTPHQREDVSALDRFNVHRCPTQRQGKPRSDTTRLPRPWGLGSNPGEDIDVYKCKVPLRHGGTLNSRRAASPLVWLVEAKGSCQKEKMLLGSSVGGGPMFSLWKKVFNLESLFTTEAACKEGGKRCSFLWNKKSVPVREKWKNDV